MWHWMLSWLVQKTHRCTSAPPREPGTRCWVLNKTNQPEIRKEKNTHCLHTRSVGIDKTDGKWRCPYSLVISKLPVSSAMLLQMVQWPFYSHQYTWNAIILMAHPGSLQIFFIRKASPWVWPVSPRRKNFSICLSLSLPYQETAYATAAENESTSLPIAFPWR